MKFTEQDLHFLKSCGIEAEPRRFTDNIFLRACGISTRLSPEEFREANKHRNFSACHGCGALTFEQHTVECRYGALDGTEQHTPPVQLDGTMRILEKFGIPTTRENYLNLAFAGHPPAELDGEIAAMLPKQFQNNLDDAEDDDICDAPSSGWCGEPSHTPVDSTPENDEDDDDN